MQAKFGCKEEFPLSPSQLQFLSNKAFQSNIFQYCNEEFKEGIRYIPYLCVCLTHDVCMCMCVCVVGGRKRKVCLLLYRRFLDREVEKLENFWQQHGLKDPFKEYVIFPTAHSETIPGHHACMHVYTSKSSPTSKKCLSHFDYN